MKLVRVLTVLVAVTISSLGIADAFHSNASCCQPGAKCCTDGSCPMCNHAGG